MKKTLIGAIAAIYSMFCAQIIWADQTGHVYGLHEKNSSLIAFTHANIWVTPEKLVKNATLVIENGQILTIKSKGRVPKGAKEIDVAGKTIYPGFIDAYTHYSFEEQKSSFSFGEPPQYTNDRVGGNSWNDALHAEQNWVDSFKPNEKEKSRWLNNGFTSVQTAKLDGIFRGQGVAVSLADGIANDLIYKSHANHFAALSKGSSKQSYPSSIIGSIALIRQTLSDAQWYKEASGKFDNLTTGTKVEYNANLEGLNELKRSGLIFDGDDTLNNLRGIKVFSEFDLKPIVVGDGIEYAKLNELKEHKVSLIIPLNFPKKPDVTTIESQLDTSLAELRHWERAPSNPAVLEKSKMTFAITQSGLKDSKEFLSQLKLAVSHGLSEKNALAALTTVPASMIGIEKIAGTIEPGKVADFFVADGNIFDNGSIESVWVLGKEHKVNEPASENFAGTYQLSINEQPLSLSLKQAKKKVTGQLTFSEKETKITVHDINDNLLQFSAEMSDVTTPGVYRFTARLNNKQLVGKYSTPTGSTHDFSSEQITPEKEEEKTDKKESSFDYISSLTYPNRAFGLKTKAKAQNTHFKNATVWTSTEKGILKNTDVIVKKGKIHSIGSKLKTPSGFKVIDASNMHLTAGIIDEHSHIAVNGGVNEGSDAITSEVRIGDAVYPDDVNIYRALAGGTTVAQLLHGSANPIGGQAQIIKLRWGDNAEQLKFKQAPGSIKFALGENVKQSNWGDKFTIRYPQSRMGVETIVRDAFLRAQDYQLAWDKYDDLSRSKKKLTSPPRKDFRLEALNEILASQRFVHSHSYVASEILSLMNIAEDFGFTIQTFTHILEGYKVADEMKKHGAMASTFSDWWAYKFEVYDAIPMNTCLMAKKGVTVSVNSDSGDLIRRLNTEAAKSIQYCGMSQEEAWKMVTINPAKQLKVEKWVGSIEEGKHADLVLWTDNPLSIYAKVSQTWIDGRLFFDRKNDQEQRVAILEEKNKLIQKVLSKEKSGEAPTQVASLGERIIFKDEPTWHCEDSFDFWHQVNVSNSHGELK